MSKYNTIPIQEHHRQLIKQHQEVIQKVYATKGQLIVLVAEEKLPDENGMFFRLTVKDQLEKTYVIKLDQPSRNHNFEEEEVF